MTDQDANIHDLSWYAVGIQEFSGFDLAKMAGDCGGLGLGGTRWVCKAPLGWAVVGSSGFVLFIVRIEGHAYAQLGTCSSEKDGKDKAGRALVAAMSDCHEAILKWQDAPETDARPWSNGRDVDGFLRDVEGFAVRSPVAASFVHGVNWATRSIDEVRILGTRLQDDYTTQDAHGIGATHERALRMARNSLAELTSFRADLLGDWLKTHQHKPEPVAPPTTYLDLLKVALQSTPDVKELFHPRCEVSLDGDKLHIVIEANEALVARFAVENKRVFKGPLFCHTCGLPAVPFGGEDICLDPHHDHVDHDADRGDRVDGDDDDDALSVFEATRAMRTRANEAHTAPAEPRDEDGDDEDKP